MRRSANAELSPGARGPSWEPLLELPRETRRHPPPRFAWLLPAPASVTLHGGVLSVSPELELVAVGHESPELSAALLRTSARLFPYGPGAPPPAVAAGAVRRVTVDVRGASRELALGSDEAYTLTAAAAAAGGDVAISAGSVFGALHALETLSQLVQYNESSRAYFMPALSISDAPRFAHRGVLLDCARHFLSPAALRVVVDIMAADKLNVLHLHLSDDDAWPLALAALPDLAARGAYSPRHVYSPADVRGLVAYARERGVRVIPEVSSPGHISVLAEARPDLLAAARDGRRCALDPSNPRTWEFLRTLFASLADLFPDAFVHVGGDELDPACWAGDAVEAWAAARNPPLRGTAEIYAWYMRELLAIVRGLGRRAVAWHEAAAAGPFGGGEVLDVWSGFYKGSWEEDAAKALAANASVIISGPFYVTGSERSPHYQQQHRSWEHMYATKPLDFLGDDAAAAAAKRVLGGQLCVWGDAAQVDSGDVYVTLAPYAHAVAELLWSPDAVTRPEGAIADARERMHFHRCRLGMRGIPSHPIYFAGAPPCPVPFAPRFEPLSLPE